MDGVGSVALLEALTSSDPEEPPPRVRRRRGKRKRGAATTGARLAALAREQIAGSFGLARRAFEAPFATLAHPRASAAMAARMVRGLRGVLSDAAARTPPRDPLAVEGSGLSRRLDVAEVPLGRLKKIKEPLGVSLNDLVLAALAGRSAPTTGSGACTRTSSCAWCR